MTADKRHYQFSMTAEKNNGLTFFYHNCQTCQNKVLTPFMTVVKRFKIFVAFFTIVTAVKRIKIDSLAHFKQLSNVTV